MSGFHLNTVLKKITHSMVTAPVKNIKRVTTRRRRDDLLQASEGSGVEFIKK